MSLCHFSDILYNLLVLLVDSQLFDCYYVLQRYHFAWWMDQPLLYYQMLAETTHNLYFSQNGVDVTIRTEFTQQLLMILDVLFGSTQF